MILASLFIVLAGFFSAVMDKTKDTIQKNSSIFKNKGDFWDDSKPAKMIPHTKYKTNAWHIAKSLMGFSFLFWGIAFRSVECNAYTVIYFIILGITSFNLFYNKVLHENR